MMEKPSLVTIQLCDQDRHGEGCDCGRCNANGKSYGAGVFRLTEVRRHQGDHHECDPLLVEYAASEASAIKNAEIEAVNSGYQLAI